MRAPVHDDGEIEAVFERLAGAVVRGFSARRRAFMRRLSVMNRLLRPGYCPLAKLKALR
jgi:hypothetical protein